MFTARLTRYSDPPGVSAKPAPGKPREERKMATKNEIEEIIRDFFGDTSRPAAETKDALEDIALLAEELAAAIDPEQGQ